MFFKQRPIDWGLPSPMPDYALFTLVGIAGEDDLDAPDLSAAGLSEAQTSPLEPEQGRGSSSLVSLPKGAGRPLAASKGRVRAESGSDTQPCQRTLRTTFCTG